ncbi:hypothetical protein [Alteromonas sp. 5E99-2]|uniref:hypothetical protein n=1 Tax=Alteromonas sp. 5E99-2 TaxID=2817683 RepID=UPI001A98171C|nr:hypothetical protein [Alteromonas sp. 5E99-2]
MFNGIKHYRVIHLTMWVAAGLCASVGYLYDLTVVGVGVGLGLGAILAYIGLCLKYGRQNLNV